MKTIAEAKKYMAENSSGNRGALCPVCDRYIKVRIHSLNEYFIRCLIVIYRYSLESPGWFKSVDPFVKLAPSLLARREHAKLALWGLLEMKSAGAGNAMKLTRITARGIQFVEGKIKVPLRVARYSGQQIDVPEALKKQAGIYDVLPKDLVKFLLKHGEAKS